MKIFTHRFHEKYDTLKSTQRFLIFLSMVSMPIFVAANIEFFGPVSLLATMLLCLMGIDRIYFLNVKRKHAK